MGGSKRFGSPKGLSSQIRLQGKRSMEIRIDEIKADFEAYAYRDDLDGETVKRYQQIIDDLPPVDVFNTEEGLILAGGYHRLEAHRQERRETITANIHQGTVFEAKMFACKANAQHGLNMTASERKRALMDFIKFSLAEDPYLSNYNIARSYGGTSEASVRRYRKSLEQSGGIERLTERRGADGRVIETGNIGEATTSTDAVNQIETLPGVIAIDGQVVTNMAEAEQAIKRIKYLGAEWAKLKSKILKMNIHADTFVQKFPTDDVADHLIDQDRDQAELIRTRLVPALDNTSRIISDLAERLTTYGQESFDLATADLLDIDKPGQLLMDGLLGEGVVQDGEAESR